MGDLIIDRQARVNLSSMPDGSYHFSFRRKTYTGSLDWIQKFFLENTDYETVKLCTGKKRSYLHYTLDSIETYASKQDLRQILSQESGGAWIEQKGKAKRFFVMEKGWFINAVKEVSDEAECIKRLNPSWLTKIATFGLGVLAVAAGANRTIRSMPAGHGSAAIYQVAIPCADAAFSALACSWMPLQAAAQTFNQSDPNATVFRVNTNTTSNQQRSCVAAMLNDSYAAAWESYGQDGDGFGIFSKIYGADGLVKVTEYRVNTNTTNNQDSPCTAGSPDGGIVYGWQSDGQDGSSYGIFSKKIDEYGNEAIPELQVNNYTDSYQTNPCVAVEENGDIVFAWQSDGQDGSSYGIFTRGISFSGLRLGDEVQVNNYTLSDQINPRVAALKGGGVIYVWASNGQDGDAYGIYGRRRNAGAFVRDEFRINSHTANTQLNPDVAALFGGGWVAVWQSAGQENASFGIYAQRFDSNDNPVGSEIHVNTYTMNDQTKPRVVGLPDGGFTVEWQSSGQDGSLLGIFRQRFDLNGDPVGSEFPQNVYTLNDQQNPDIAVLASGWTVGTWDSFGEDGSLQGVYGRRSDANGMPVTPGDLPIASSTAVFANASSGEASTLQSEMSPSSSPSSLLSSIPPFANSSSETTDTSASTSASSSTGPSATATSQVISPIIITYGETYSFAEGTFVISGGSGSLNSANINTIHLYYSSNFYPYDGQVVTVATGDLFDLFSQATAFQNLVVEGADFSCYSATSELTTTADNQKEFNIIFTAATSCSSNEAAGLEPSLM